MTFGEVFLAHFLAILLGGLKVMAIGWLFWWIIRKKYLKKMIQGLMKDIGEAMGIPLGVPTAPPVAVAPRASDLAPPSDFASGGGWPVLPPLIIPQDRVCVKCGGLGRSVEHSQQGITLHWCSECGGAGYHQ